MRLFLALALLLCTACTMEITRVPMHAGLVSATTSPPATRPRIAVLRPPIVTTRRSRVPITYERGMSFPSASHQAAAVPEALRERGFDVVEIVDPQQVLGAEYVLQLDDPIVEAIAPGSGRMDYLGSLHRLRVTYGGALRRGDGSLITRVHGEMAQQMRLWWSDPLIRMAITGTATALATAMMGVLILVALLAVGLVAAQGLDARGNVLCERLRTVDQAACNQAAPATLALAFIVASTISGALAGQLAETAAGHAVDSVASALELSQLLPGWEQMAQDAHDGAARALAEHVDRMTQTP